MEKRHPVTIDMTPDGRFAAPPQSFRPTWPVKIGVMAVLVAVGATFLAVAALFLWLALWLIPVALVAGAIAWASLRYQMWKMRRSGGPQRGLNRFQAGRFGQ